MDREFLKSIIIDHRQYWKTAEVIPRDLDLESDKNYCFTGMKGVGKSYVLYGMIRKLIDSKIPEECIYYLDFSDERLSQLTRDDLYMLMEFGWENFPAWTPYYFFDEIQNIADWKDFVKLMWEHDYHLSFTGQDLDLESYENQREIGSKFTCITVYPYSFREFCRSSKVDTELSGLDTPEKKSKIYDAYAHFRDYGGFPEVIKSQIKTRELSELLKTYYLCDIAAKNQLTNIPALRLILRKIAQNTGQPISYNKLTNMLKDEGISVGKQTVINYLRILTDSGLIIAVRNYVGELSEKDLPVKYYFLDQGLTGLYLVNDRAAQLETLVALELIRRYGSENVYFYKARASLDFIVPDGKLAVQVNGSEKDIKRLKKQLIGYRKMILTNSEERMTGTAETEIDMVPVWKWLLS